MSPSTRTFALLDDRGTVIGVNDKWRRFGALRDATSDSVGLNYLEVCAKAAARGDKYAKRVASGLRNVLTGKYGTFGLAYRCQDRTFRMSVRPLRDPAGGLIVAHQDITALLQARLESKRSQRRLGQLRRAYAKRVDHAHEEINQRLSAISLAAGAMEQGGNVADAVSLIRLAIEEARNELRLLRYDVCQDSPKRSSLLPP